MYSGSGDIPVHQYCYVDSSLIRKDKAGFEPCIWFAVHGFPARMWGCHIMLECGAIYRNIPPHMLAFSENPEPKWRPEDAQLWDCYGSDFSTIRYRYLADLDVEVWGGKTGRYLFTVVPLHDAFSEEPTQAKEFMFVQLDNGRLTIQPTNRLLFKEKSFTDKDAKWPTNLKLTNEVWTCE